MFSSDHFNRWMSSLVNVYLAVSKSGYQYLMGFLNFIRIFFLIILEHYQTSTEEDFSKICIH
ncbi:unnamed protein product [Nezara viridula]|uniref:Uncharacterized protein n=1 Tax=Nezara viridula TaxID=85310 RepID=A0A9P0H956_NEZVI|nr:unnamed protein product [Nezara viridula]